MITFSGIDCSGKSTQIEIIKKYYDDIGVRYRVIWSRGGYTPWIEGIKNLLRKDKNYTAEQKEAYRKHFQESFQKQKLLLWASIIDLIRYYGIVFRFIELFGTTIVCDRYIWDTYIDFQIKYPRIDFENWFVWKMLLKFMKKPRQSIVFTIPADISMQRSCEKNDPHSESYEVRKVRIEKYEKEIENGRWQYVIDATKTVNEVSDEIEDILREKSVSI